MKIKHTDKTKYFKTSNFYLSAFLQAKGINLVDIDKSNPRQSLFVFNETEDRQSLAEDFLFGRGSVEPRKFAQSIKSLKQLLYSNL